MATKRTRTIKKKKATVKKPVNFWIWLRVNLRTMTLKAPSRKDAIEAAKIPYIGSNKRRKWSYVCANCSGEFVLKGIAVDHKLPAGTLLCWDDVVGFMQRLFCGVEGLQVLCKRCHNIKSYMENNNVTYEEAVVQKRAIEICKLPKSKLLAMLNHLGYTGVSVSNADKRRKLVTELLRKGDMK